MGIIYHLGIGIYVTVLLAYFRAEYCFKTSIRVLSYFLSKVNPVGPIKRVYTSGLLQ